VADVSVEARRAVVRYAFVGLSSRAGATTLAFAFADWLARGGAGRDAESVTVVEISEDCQQACGSDYDRIGIDMRFAGREYVSPYVRVAAGGSVRGVRNMDGGINWLLRTPGEACGDLDIADYVRLSSGVSGDAVIVDVKGGFGGAARISALSKLISDCDRIFAIIDPLPSALMADVEKLELFKSLESGGADVMYVINKMNPGVDVREMRSFIRVRNAVEIPFLAPEGLYASEYNCCTVYSMPKLAPLLDRAFGAMTL
jgi:hypothetical protein